MGAARRGGSGKISSILFPGSRRCLQFNPIRTFLPSHGGVFVYFSRAQKVAAFLTLVHTTNEPPNHQSRRVQKNIYFSAPNACKYFAFFCRIGVISVKSECPHRWWASVQAGQHPACDRLPSRAVAVAGRTRWQRAAQGAQGRPASHADPPHSGVRPSGAASTQCGTPDPRAEATKACVQISQRRSTPAFQLLLDSNPSNPRPNQAKLSENARLHFHPLSARGRPEAFRSGD